MAGCGASPAQSVKVGTANAHRPKVGADRYRDIKCTTVVGFRITHIRPLTTGETAESLEARVTALEPAFFVETLRGIAEGALELPGG